MEYNLKIAGRSYHLETQESRSRGNNDKMSLIIDGISCCVDYTIVGENQIHLNVDGRRYNAYVAELEEGKEIFIEGAVFHVIDEDRTVRSGKKASAVPEPETVTPPMPAVVISVTVMPGDVVAAGQGLVVVSAMKMETTLKAPYNGVVEAVKVKEGDKVNPGDILVDVIRAQDVN